MPLFDQDKVYNSVSLGDFLEDRTHMDSDIISVLLMLTLGIQEIHNLGYILI